MRDDSIFDDVLPVGTLPTQGDTYIAKHAISLANRNSRRSFLGLVGRASVALMGGVFIDLWKMESAQAACVWQNYSDNPSCRSSCLCTELIGSNVCQSPPNCCSGFWTSCITNTNDPANSCSGGQCKKVKLYDCCATCNCTSHTCGQSCCNNGYCAFSGSGCMGQKVKCVRKICTTINCSVPVC